jgi:hypothetical protein
MKLSLFILEPGRIGMRCGLMGNSPRGLDFVATFDVSGQLSPDKVAAIKERISISNAGLGDVAILPYQNSKK